VSEVLSKASPEEIEHLIKLREKPGNEFFVFCKQLMEKYK
jgi:hypothetical protein